MKSGHDEIKELLPDYLRGLLPEGVRFEVKNHLEGCPDCKAELWFISDVVDAGNVPDPGEFFWKTLPQRVKASVKEEKKNKFSVKTLLLRPLFIAAAVIVISLAFFFYTKRADTPETTLFFNNPLMVSVLDYSGITEKDIPAVDERLNTDDLSPGYKNHTGYGYHIDFASLSSKELESLYEALKKEQETGG